MTVKLEEKDKSLNNLKLQYMQNNQKKLMAQYGDAANVKEQKVDRWTGEQVNSCNLNVTTYRQGVEGGQVDR